MRPFARPVSLACLLVSLAFASPAIAEFKPLAGFDRQIFPSFIISTASMRADSGDSDKHTLGDSRGLLGVEVVAPADKAPITVEVQCADYLETSVFTGVLPKAGETYRVFPTIRYRYAKLARCSQTTPTAVTFRVKVGDADETKSVICTMRTVNDCPFCISGKEGDADVSFTFAAYVNEQHPFVDKLLREALDGEIVESFGGYQSSPDGVFLEAYALWDLLVQRNFQYSNITTSVAVSPTVGSQHVRLLEDSVNNSEANCVDGSVLWASLLQRIGVDSFLVMEPTHCYAGFYLDEEHKHCIAIETTMLGSTVDLDDLDVPEEMGEAIPEDLRNDDSFASFIAAVQYGTSRLNASLNRSDDSAGDEAEAASAEEGDDEEAAPPVQIIDVPSARKIGILPIPYQKNEDFVWYEASDAGDDESDDAAYSEDDSEASDEEVMSDDEGYDEDQSSDDEEEEYDEEE